ncbi:MAG: hypothetical protein RIS70_348 [Planctomycetota bacterium]
MIYPAIQEIAENEVASVHAIPRHTRFMFVSPPFQDTHV